MKIKKTVIILSVLMLFLLIAGVSANDINTTEQISNTDDIDGNILENSISDSSKNIISESGNNNSVLKEEYYDDFYKYNTTGNVSLKMIKSVRIGEYVSELGDYLATVYDHSNSNINGKIILSIDNKEYYNKSFYDYNYMKISLYANSLNLPDNLKTGFHNVTLSYFRNGDSTPYIFNNYLEFDYNPTIKTHQSFDTLKFTFDFLSGSSGNITIYEDIRSRNGVFNASYIGSRYDGSWFANFTKGVISDGKCEITVKKPSVGYHEYKIFMDVNNKTYHRNLNIKVEEPDSSMTNTTQNNNNTNSSSDFNNSTIITNITQNNNTNTSNKSSKLDSKLMIGIYADNRLTLGNDGVIYGQLDVGQWVEYNGVLFLSTNVPSFIVSIDGKNDSAYVVNRNIIKFRNLDANQYYTLRVLVNDTEYNQKEYEHTIYIWGNENPYISVITNKTSFNNSNNTISTNNNDDSQNTPVNSEKITAIIIAKKATFKTKMKTKKYIITLKSGKNGIKNVKVYLKIKGKTYKATTNKYGKATFKITKLNKKGSFTGNVKFDGNKLYNAVSKKVTIKIK